MRKRQKVAQSGERVSEWVTSKLQPFYFLTRKYFLNQFDGSDVD